MNMFGAGSPASGVVVVLLGLPVSLPLHFGHGCQSYVDLFRPMILLTHVANTSGSWSLPLPIPNDNALNGIDLAAGNPHTGATLLEEDDAPVGSKKGTRRHDEIRLEAENTGEFWGSNQECQTGASSSKGGVALGKIEGDDLHRAIGIEHTHRCGSQNTLEGLESDELDELQRPIGVGEDLIDIDEVLGGEGWRWKQ